MSYDHERKKFLDEMLEHLCRDAEGRNDMNQPYSLARDSVYDPARRVLTEHFWNAFCRLVDSANHLAIVYLEGKALITGEPPTPEECRLLKRFIDFCGEILTFDINRKKKAKGRAF